MRDVCPSLPVSLSPSERTGFLDGFHGRMSENKHALPRDQWCDYLCGFLEGEYFAEHHPDYVLPPV